MSTHAEMFVRLWATLVQIVTVWGQVSRPCGLVTGIACTDACRYRSTCRLSFRLQVIVLDVDMLRSFLYVWCSKPVFEAWRSVDDC